MKIISTGWEYELKQKTETKTGCSALFSNYGYKDVIVPVSIETFDQLEIGKQYTIAFLEKDK